VFLDGDKKRRGGECRSEKCKVLKRGKDLGTKGMLLRKNQDGVEKKLVADAGGQNNSLGGGRGNQCDVWAKISSEPGGGSRKLTRKRRRDAKPTQEIPARKKKKNIPYLVRRRFVGREHA